MTSKILLLALLVSSSVFSQGTFFRQHWAKFDPIINNNPHDTRTRVNDATLSLHERFGPRSEAPINGLMMIQVPENLFELSKTFVYLEVWGGHPLTENKRFILNGKETYVVPAEGTEDNHCVYSYPLIPVKTEHLVTGLNALQFACDRGKTFWGHFIIDEAAVICELKPDHPDLKKENLSDFSATVAQAGNIRVLPDNANLQVSIAEKFIPAIASVEYFGRYEGYDDNGNRLENDWHGYTHDKVTKMHIGTAKQPPFSMVWDTRMIPDQGTPMAIKARINFQNGISYWTPVQDGLTFAKNRKKVMLFKCSPYPEHFWSRANKPVEAQMLLPEDLSAVESATMLVRIWDGGEGAVKEPFTLNGFAYPITSGKGIHDVVFTQNAVPKEHLRPGANKIVLLSDTEHHGIEMLMPGPALIIRFK